MVLRSRVLTTPPICRTGAAFDAPTDRFALLCVALRCFALPIARLHCTSTSSLRLARRPRTPASDPPPSRNPRKKNSTHARDDATFQGQPPAKKKKRTRRPPPGRVQPSNVPAGYIKVPVSDYVGMRVQVQPPHSTRRTGLAAVLVVCSSGSCCAQTGCRGGGGTTHPPTTSRVDPLARHM